MRRFHDYPKAHDDYKFSRILYYVECLLEYFISILVSGAYLAKLTTTIGISDGMTAILSELTALSGIFQILSIYLSHKTPVKRWLIPTITVPQLLFAGVYLIPLFDLPLSSSVLFFVAIFAARAIASVTSPIKLNWFMSLVEPTKRGQFSATNVIISTIGAMAFTFTASSLIDYFEAAGNMNGAYLTFSIMILVLTALHVLSLVLAKENAPPTVFKNESPFASVGSLLKNKAYMRVIVLYALFGIASATTTPFLGTFQISELGFSMTFISTVTIVLSFLNILAVFLAGKYSIKHSYTSLFIGSYIFGLIGFGFIIFTTTANGYFMFTAYRVFNLFFGAAAGISSITTFLRFATDLVSRSWKAPSIIPISGAGSSTV